MVRNICVAKETHRTQRRLGEKYRWKRAKKKEPTQKDMREMPERHRRADGGGWTREASPRPT
jgi:hypothetical protein